MFDKLYSYPKVLQRHRAAPLAAEREAFLELLEGYSGPRFRDSHLSCLLD